MPRFIPLLTILLTMLGAPARADESVQVCFNFGCAAEQTIVFPETRLIWAEEVMAAADSAERERQLLAQVVGRLYAWAGESSPIHVDRAGNFNDGGVHGGMDCVDHTTTTTRFLHLLEKRGALHFHRVSEPAVRGWLWLHVSARIDEISPDLMQAETGQARRFAVDSWYVDHGRPAPVMPIEVWEEADEPEQI